MKAILWILLVQVISCGCELGKKQYIYLHQNDCRGGINEEPENAKPNQVLDARNVWCPTGRLEQRPGYSGVSFIGSDVRSPETPIFISESPAGNFTTANPLELDGLSVGDRWYIGWAAATGFGVTGIDVSNGNATRIAAEYYNGSEWYPILVTELTGNGFATDFSVASYHLDDASGTTTVAFTCAVPSDWAATTVDSNTKYFLRFTVLDSVLSNNSAVINSGSGTYTGVNFRGGFAAQFPTKKRYILLSYLSGASQSINVYNAASLRYQDQVQSAIGDGSLSELANFAIIPQFNEVYAAYDHQVTVHTPEPASAGSTLAMLEDRPEYVGTVAGIKSDYHPDYVAQLNAFPTAQYVEFFHGQLWAANLKNEPYTVRWSAPQPAYKVWPEESFELLMEDDNSPITGMKAFGEHLAVFKQDSIWRMVYNGIGGVAQLNTYTPVKVPGSIGVVSNSSIIDINGTLIFMSEDGIYAFDGVSKPQKISEPINETFATINAGARQSSVAVHWKSENCYLLAVPTNGSAVNNRVLVYEYNQGAWWIWDNIEAQIWVRDESPSDEEVIYFGDSSGSVFELGVGSTDHGALIESYVETQRFGYGDFTTKNLRQVRINAENDDITSLDVTVKREDENSSGQTTGTMTFRDANENVVGDTTLVSDSSPLTVHVEKRAEKRLDFRKTGDWFTVKVLNDEKNKPMKINRISVGLASTGAKR